MELLQEIESFLTQALKRFNQLHFKVGYGASDTTFVIEVSPSSEYSCNEELAGMMLDFSEDFETKHPECTIIFKREDDILCKIKNVILEKKSFIQEPEYPSPEYEDKKFEFNFKSIHNEWIRNLENKYVLAA